MRASRKIGLAVVVTVVALPLLLVLIVFLFRGRIAERVRAEVARAVDAQVRWARVDVGVLRDFPNVSVRLDDLSVIGVKRFAGDTLVAMRRFGLDVSLGSVLRSLRAAGPLVVRAVEMERPVVRLRVLEDGAASWDIARTQPGAATADTGRALSLSLRRLAITGGDVRFENRRTALFAALGGLDLTLRGDFAKSSFTLATGVRAREVSLRFAGVPYLGGAALALDADVAADTRNHRFTFRNDRLRLNALELAFGGTLGVGGERPAVDLTFSTPSTRFADLLSLVPAVYARDFAKLQSAGRMALSGRVHGETGPGAFPALALRARVDDGAFRYPDLPLPVRDIALLLAVDNPGGHPDSTVVRLDRFHMALGGRAVDARLALRTPVSDPDVDLALKGSIDLADLRRAVKMPNVKELTGILAADLTTHTRKSWVDAGQYDRIAAAGTLDVSRVTLRSDSIPRPLAIDSARLRFTPRRVELPALAGRVGSSDVHASGALDNLLGFLLHDEPLRGDATVESKRFDLNEWRSSDSTEAIPVPPNVDLTLRAAAERVRFGTLEMANVRGGLRVKDRRASLDQFRMDVLGGTVVASGFYETTTPAVPTFSLGLRVDSVDVPTAFTSLVTVQRLAPIARYARGRASTALDVAGAVGKDMSPRLDKLTGHGALEVARLAIEGFPAFTKLADALTLQALRDPTLRAIKASFHIEQGRVNVQPFDVKVGDVAMTVSGSTGIDQSIDYDLALAVPTSLLGADAARTIGSLAARAGRAGLALGDAAAVSVDAKVTGTVTAPIVRPSFRGTVGSVRENAQQAVQAEIERRKAALQARADSATQEARRRAGAEAARLVAEAEERAATVRREADSLAARVRREADRQADSLVARASSPAARIAADAAARQLRRQADAQATRIVKEADDRAKALVEEARRQGQALMPPGA